MMPIRLPLTDLLLPVRRVVADLTEARIARYRCVVILLPAAPGARIWAEIPYGELLREVYEEAPRNPGESVTLRVGTRARTVLVAACIAAQASTFEQLKTAGKVARTVLDGAPRSLLICTRGLEASAADAALCATVSAIEAARFRLQSFKREPAKPLALERIDVAAGRIEGLDAALATAAGNNLARWLTALPPNVLDAKTYRRLLQELAHALELEYTFYNEARLKRLGAGAFLAVAQGNATRDAGIVRLTYRPRGRRPPAVSLVGKGICFDTGGTNLKPHKSMLDMHTDMEGSAVAIGSLYALHALGSTLAVDCWLAITENRIGPQAYLPQDVIRASNGTTIQIIHTDAEGRLVLADTLCLAAGQKPGAIIDYATLTGACVYALTERYSGAFTNRPSSRAAIEHAGSASGERVWCFPMDEDYDSDLDSAVADVLQCAVDGKGDHILAAKFLSRFVPNDIPWLHLDLAAGTRAGGLAHIPTEITGFGVRYTVELLANGWPSVAT